MQMQMQKKKKKNWPLVCVLACCSHLLGCGLVLKLQNCNIVLFLFTNRVAITYTSSC